MGTAPRGTFWVLIEHRGGWPVNGFDGLDLDRRVRSEVFHAAQVLRARILLIRRHGKRVRDGPGVWAVMHLGGPGNLRQVWGTWNRDTDLLDVRDALQQCEEQTGTVEDRRSPLILVCAHGQHDACCAIRGRPVAEALSRRWPELVWECTHVGGDRFAANVLVVPDGVYYGNLDSESAVKVIERHLSDQIGFEHLRGYTDLAPVEQVAVAAAIEHNGPAGRFDYSITEIKKSNGVWTVQLASRGPELAHFNVELEQSRSQREYLTCRGAERAIASTFTVRHVHAWPARDPER